MQTSLLDLNKTVDHEKPVVLHAELSFKPFITFLQQKIAEETTSKSVIYQLALDTFAAYPTLADPIAGETDLGRYAPLLEQIYTILTPVTAAEKDYLWALCLPVKPVVFYGTDAFYRLICEECNGVMGLKSGMIIQSDSDHQKKQKALHFYSMIMEKLYGIPFGHNEMVYKTVDEHTGLLRYYRLDFDDRFITVTPRGTLPELSIESFQSQMEDDTSGEVPVELLSKLLPLDQFNFEGFSVIALTDVTAEHAVNTLKEIAIEHTRNAGAAHFATIELALKSIVGNPEIRFGLQPLLRVNNQLVFSSDTGFKSILLDLARKYGFGPDKYQGFVEDYIKSPRLLFIRSITSLHKELSPPLKILAQNGVVSFIIAPLYYQGRLAGVLEAFSGQENSINEKMLSQLKSATLVLSQLLQQAIDDLQADVTRVITDKFTPLQPAVQWKFNEAAWQYLREEQRQKNPELPAIVFEDVYPLYGAVDIRNSTDERNKALQTDLEVHVQILNDTMRLLQKYKDNAWILNEEVARTCKEWMYKIERKMSPYQAMKAEDYLHREIPVLFNQIAQQNPAAMPVVKAYMQAIDEHEGITYQQRRELETSMQLINRTVGDTLDHFNAELQETYPCYFEKFRTDGVEYDIYAGQSIAPHAHFDNGSLKKIRHRQLEVMALITQQTKALLPQMPKALQTTQLIFVHGSKIDISFRTDEKRFDVQGSYNIRYQMAKKRIDKAYIKDSSQRLTQPGMIAIVYSGHSEIEDYLESISQLQQAGILHPETEKVELEELQGLTGLKALRVRVLDSVVLQ
jgi:GAF domain-containing protein